MELRHYFSIIWKWLWLIVLSVAVAAAFSFYAALQQPKIYQASTKMLVGQSIQSTNPNSQDIYTSQQLAVTYIQIAKTTPVLQGALNALGLTQTAEQLSQNFNASIIQGTQLIELRIVDTDPARAQALANELAHQLTLQGPAAPEQEQARRREFVRSQVDEIQRKIEEAQNAIADLQSSIQVTSTARDLADKQQQITALQVQINQWQTSYANLLAFLAPQSPNYLSVIEPAQLPREPIAPNVPLIVLLAMSLGLMLGVGGAFVLEHLDDTLKSSDEITQVLGLSTIGAIARIPASEDQKLVAAVAPRSAIAEAYRVLRTNIQFSSVDRTIKSILVTSPNPGEGKSITAANLAVVMAQAGLATILVDADLRKPAQHSIFGISNSTGVTNGLLNPATLDGFVRPTRVENLRLITTGVLPPNPAELLASARMRALITRLAAESDIVIFDSPPCLPLADSIILAQLVDGVVMVVDSAHTRRASATRAKELLEKVSGRLLGVVLNRVPARANNYYYYQYTAADGKPPRETRTTPARLAGFSLTDWLSARRRD